MQPLNAIDAIAPAFTRTHQTLFQPFRIGRSWKLAASQVLGFYGAMFVPAPLFLFLIPSTVFDQMPAARGVLMMGSLIFTLIGLIFLYLFTRMELVNFEMLVTRNKFIAPMWRRYSRRVWPWFGFKILVGTVFTALILALFLSPIHHLIQGLMATTPLTSFTSLGPKPDPEAIQAILAPIMQQWIVLQYVGYAMFFLLKIPSTLLNDFVLPFFVLEDIPLTEALSRGFRVLLADPLNVLGYLVLKPVLAVIGYIMLSIVSLIAVIPLAIVFGIVAAIGGIAGASMHSSAGGAAFGFGFLALMLVFTALMVYFSFFTSGYMLALFEAYGIYFLGGRYPLLGNLLEPGPDKPFTPPPVFPSEEERIDDDGGPPMPMDPAVA